MRPASAATAMAERDNCPGDNCPGCWGQPILPLPGNNKEDAIAVAIDFAASHNFKGISNGIDENDNDGDGVRAGGKRKRGTDEEEIWRRRRRRRVGGG
jgi:hypothetical protein